MEAEKSGAGVLSGAYLEVKRSAGFLGIWNRHALHRYR